MIQAVIFDMDGVLIDSEPIYLEQLLQFVRRKNPKVRWEELSQVAGRSGEDCWERIRMITHSDCAWQMLRQEYRDSRKRQPPMNYRAIFRQEVIGVLKELKERGIKAAVASSTDLAIIEYVLRENHIRDEFQIVVSGEMFHRSKPDPEIYRYTVRLLEVENKDCLAVEDSTVGIMAAKAAGLKTAALIDKRFGFEQWRADWQFETLGDIIDII